MSKYVAVGRSSKTPRGQWRCSHTDCDELVYQPQAHYHLCASHLVELLRMAGVKKPTHRLTADMASANLARAIKRGTQVVGEVYYVKLARDRVKIGFTTNLHGRMSSLRTTAPDLELLACESGTVALERRRHEQFAHLRVEPKHEVFTLGSDLAAWIDVVRLAGVA